MHEINIKAASKREIKGESFTLNYTLSENQGLLIYVTEGKVKADFNSKPVQLSKNTFILCEGKDTFTCSFSNKNTVSLYFVLFTYSGNKSVKDTYNLKNSVYCCTTPDVICNELRKFVREFIIRTPRYSESTGSLFLEILHKLSRSTEEKNSVSNAVYALAEQINENFNSEIDVNSYAEGVNLSKDRFSVIFKEYFGYPPYKYQLMVKMNEALTLLKNTDLPISKISALLGFSSQLYFSNAFKKHMGMTPTEARRA